MFPNLIANPDAIAERRRQLMDRLGGAAALFVAGRAPTRTHTMSYPFRPDSDFFYLTGFREPEAALLLLPGRGRHEAIAFVRPSDRQAEAWNGRRLGLDDAPAALGVDRAFPFAELEERLPGLIAGHETLCYPLGGHADVDALVLALIGHPRARIQETPATVVHPRAVLHEQRLIKSADEIARMRTAASVTAAGFEAALATIRPGANERDVHAALESTFRRLGADGPAYNPIVAGGANATILHYTDNDAPLQPQELVLVDAGAEVGCYASDVTRTYPISGRFTEIQRAVYDIVLKAQEAAIDCLRVGVPFTRYHDKADEVLTAGLVALGVLNGPLDELIAAKAHQPYTLHRAGHFLGLDTHDVGRVAPGGVARELAAGMVLTVEPGLYFPLDDLSLAVELRGIGIRIEDDVLVTDGEPEVLTAAIPK